MPNEDDEEAGVRQDASGHVKQKITFAANRRSSL